MKKIIEGLPPIANQKPVVLILGSMPSEESLRKQEYYGHPRNAFWKIMARLFEFDFDSPYSSRKRNLLTNNLAVWDVLQSCERKGSLDSSIVDETITENDFAAFYQNHPDITQVFFNGTKAESEYYKRVIPALTDKHKKIKTTRLPSTSPAMASLSFEKKLLQWSIVKKELEQSLQNESIKYQVNNK